MNLTYAFHGLLVLLIGMLGGLPFSKAIKSQNGREVAWRVVHSGGSMGGVMLIAIGAVVFALNLPATFSWILSIGFILGTHLLVAGMVIAAITGCRGLTRESARTNLWQKVVFIMYGAGAVLSLMATVSLLIYCGFKLFL